MSDVLPDFDDEVPVIEDAEPEDAEVEHLLESPDGDGTEEEDEK